MFGKVGLARVAEVGGRAATWEKAREVDDVAIDASCLSWDQVPTGCLCFGSIEVFGGRSTNVARDRAATGIWLRWHAFTKFSSVKWFRCKMKWTGLDDLEKTQQRSEVFMRKQGSDTGSCVSRG